jgi:cyanophycin synthetase
MIKLKINKTFGGPSPFASEPVVVATLDAPPMTAQQVQHAIGAMEEYCSDWFENTGTPDMVPGHLVAHVLASWSLAALNRRRGFLHEAGARPVGGAYVLWVAYHHPDLTIQCLKLAVQFFDGVARGHLSRDRVDEVLEKFWKLCQMRHPDFQARILMMSARHCDLPYFRYLDGTKFWQFGWGANSMIFEEACANEEPRIGGQLARDKSASKRVMSILGVPVVKHVLVRSEDQLEEAAQKIGWPCVTKPLDGWMAKGVTIDIRDVTELKAGFTTAKESTTGPVMVESYVPGDVHRLLVVRGELRVAVRRERPHVIADGKSTVRELVRQLNASRDTGDGSVSRIGKVPEDDEYLVTLSKQGLSPESVPETGCKVNLRRIPFQSVGGINTHVTDIVHRDVKIMAETLAVSLGIRIAGLDYVTEDISKSYRDGGAVVEINLGPSLPPLVTDRLDEVALGRMVLGEDLGRIPVHLLLVQQHKVEDFARALPYGNEIGWVCQGQIGLGETTLDTRTDSLAGDIRNLLRNRKVRVALIIATVDQIEAEGMPVDRVDRVLLQDQSVADPWNKVLRAHSNAMLTISSPGDVAEFFRA